MAYGTRWSSGDHFGVRLPVPGNDDVDHRVVKGDAGVRNAQSAIRNAEESLRERELRIQLSDRSAGKSLLAPLQAYNDFASEFDCQLFSPEQLYWYQSLELNNGFVLRIYGLTSTLLSGAGALKNAPDTRLSLYLSPLQTGLDPVDNVVNLVMCHHPPDWFLDQDQIEDALRGRASIHLFGHKHRQRYHQGYHDRA